MKKRYKFLIPLFIFVSFCGLSVWAIKSGVMEDYLSQTKIPFTTFYKSDIISVVNSEVKSDPKLDSVDSYNKVVSVLNKDLSGSNDIKISEALTDKGYDILNNKLTPELALDNRFIVSVVNSGVIQTKYGWGFILTFNIADDTDDIQNISFEAQLNKGKINILSEVNKVTNKFAYIGIPKDFNFSLIDKEVERSTRNITELLPQELKVYSKNTVLSEVKFDINTLKVEQTYKTGTQSDVKETKIETSIK